MCAEVAAAPASGLITKTFALESNFDCATSSVDSDISTPVPAAEDALTRFLALIGGIHAIDELSPGYLQRTMGVAVEHALNDPHRYGASAALTHQWSYSFGVDQTATAGKWFEFSFIPVEAGASPPMTEICKIDFDSFAQRLEAMGFKRQRNIGEHGRWISDFFSRQGMRVEVFSRGEGDAPHERVEHHCVEWIYVR